MRALIIQPWVSYRGAETVSVLEAYYLNKLGHKAKIACLYVDYDRLPPHGEEIEYILPPRVLSWLFAKSKLFFFIFNIPVLFWVVFKAASDFEVLNPHNLPSPWVAAIVSKLKKRRIVWTAHGVPPQAGFARTFLNLIFWRLGVDRLDWWAVRQGNLVLAVSERVAKEVRERYGVKVSVAFPPIEQIYYSGGDGKEVRRKFGIADDVFLLLHVSRLHPAKEPFLSLRTLAKVKDEIKGASLIFVGGGEAKGKLLALAEDLGMGDSVHFAGFVEPSELKDFYAAADLTLVPYWRTEGWPATPFQALSAGTISVVARGSGADEIILREEIGLVAEPNVEDFSEAVLEFYKNRKKWEKVAQKGKAYVQKNLSGEAYAERFLEMTRSILVKLP